MARVDLKYTYRSVSISDENRLTGLKVALDSQIIHMRDTKLGSRLAPGMFHRLT